LTPPFAFLPNVCVSRPRFGTDRSAQEAHREGSHSPLSPPYAVSWPASASGYAQRTPEVVLRLIRGYLRQLAVVAGPAQVEAPSVAVQCTIRTLNACYHILNPFKNTIPTHTPPINTKIPPS